MDQAAARERFVAARTAALATVDAAGTPHLVPIVFTVDGNVLAFAVDHKPKTTTNLRRLRNIAENDRVCLLVDHYDDDWSRLWWVRADGRAAVAEDPARWIERLADRYAQYRERPPQGPVVTITVDRWRGWSAR